MKERKPVENVVEYIKQTEMQRVEHLDDENLNLWGEEITAIMRESESVKDAIYLAYNLGLCVAINNMK